MQKITEAPTYNGKIYIPQNTLCCCKMNSLWHDYNQSSDFGALRTAEFVSGDNNCPALDAKIRQFNALCEVYHQLKVLHHTHHGINMTLLSPSAPSQGITMDSVMDLPKSIVSYYTHIAVILH